jgi:serine/threonine protein kinase
MNDWDPILELFGMYMHITNYFTLILVNRYYELFRTGEGMTEGLLLDEANLGDLQSYIESNSKIDDNLKRKWSLQISEAVAYVHKNGIIHSIISTTNVLVIKVTYFSPILEALDTVLWGWIAD